MQMSENHVVFLKIHYDTPDKNTFAYQTSFTFD